MPGWKTLSRLPQIRRDCVIARSVRQKRYSRPFRPNTSQFQVRLDQRDRGESKMLTRAGVGDEVVGWGLEGVLEPALGQSGPHLCP